MIEEYVGFYTMENSESDYLFNRYFQAANFLHAVEQAVDALAEEEVLIGVERIL